MAEELVAEAIARLMATAERIADPASVRSVAKGLDKAQAEAVAQVLGAGVSLLTGGPGTGKSRTVAADRQAAAGQGHRHRAGRAHRPGGQAAGGAHRPPGGHRAPAARGAGHLGRVLAQRGVAARRRRRRGGRGLDAGRRADRRPAGRLPRRHAPAAGRRPGAAALDRPRPRARRHDRLRRRPGDRADHALPAGRGRRDRPPGHGRPRRRAAPGRLPRPRGRRRARHRQRRGGAAGRAAGHRLDPAGAGHRARRRCRSSPRCTAGRPARSS